MNNKEHRQEEKELEQAVRVLRSTLRSIAHRKAARYEQEFLHRVRDMLDEEIADHALFDKHETKCVVNSVEQARKQGLKTVCLEWERKDSPKWVLDWYLRQGYDEKEFGRDCEFLVKQISD